MQYNEVKGIAKSIARWVWKRDGYCYQEFIDRQKRRGTIGGRKSKGGGRPSLGEPWKTWEFLVELGFVNLALNKPKSDNSFFSSSNVIKNETR